MRLVPGLVLVCALIALPLASALAAPVKPILPAVVLLPHTIMASAGANGSISPSGVVLVDDGSDQAFTITADACYDVDDVLVDGSSVGAVGSYTFTNVTADHTIEASFAIDVDTIAASAGTGGTISPSGNVPVNCGSNQAFSIAANSCYTLADVLVDGSSVGAVTGYTFTNVTANHTIAASFSLNTFTIAASAGTGGSITPSGNVSVNCGSNQAFTITANSCYTLSDVLVDGSSVGAVTGYTFTNVTANHTIAASFTQNTFTIAASAGTGGTITPSGNVSVNCGSNQAFSIAANSCYTLSDVLVDGSSVGAVSSYTFTNVTANHTIAASFTQNTFTIAASAGTGGTITPSGNVSVNCGASQAFTIAANSCYHIAGVLVDGSSVGAVSSYTFTNVTANHTIAASFTQNTFTIAASAGTGGTITPSGNVSVNCGSNQAFSIAANSCYTLSDVLVDGSSVGAVSSYTFTNVTANHTIAASFTQNTFTIAASAGTGGTITPSGNVLVNCGSNQAFSIAASSCYTLANVLVDGSSVGAVTGYTFTNVTANHTIAASFTQNTFTIAASAGTGGTITPSGNVSVNCGSSQAFTIVPTSCYSIASVLVDGSSVGAVSGYTFTNVTANHTIAASFTQNTFTIAASAGTGGTITPSGNVVVNCGSSQAFAIAANSCYSIASVLVDGSSVGAVSSYTFTNVTANHTITASFTLNTYTIAASAGTGGTITPSGNVSVNCGSNQAFSIAASSCYTLADVLVDGSSVGAVTGYTFTNVTTNHTIAASFNVKTYTIAASAGTGGTITPSGNVSVNCGSNQSFAIAPSSCYSIASVLVDGSSVGAVSGYTFTNVTANHTIAASFALNTFTIAASAGTGGTITPSGNVSVNCGSNQSFAIAPGSCYSIASVLVDGSSVGAVSGYTFTNVTANHTIAASFALNTFTIAASAGTGGTITPSGNVSVNCGSSQAFSIAAGSCYTLTNVLVDGSSVGAVTGYTFTNVTANHTIAATFTVKTNTITASAGTGGTIAPSGNVIVDCGSNQVFSIAPSSCYSIASVLVDGSSVGAVSSYTFTNVTANHTISASFTFNTYTITASAGTGGTITPSGNVSVSCGSNQAFSIAANSCYSIASVLVDGSSVGAVSSYTFANVTANHTIAANFSLNTFTIAASAGTGGSISPSGNVSVNCGSNQAFSISASSCFTLTNVVVDGSSVGAVTGYTFTNVTTNHTIAASFTENTYTISASAGTGGTITPSGDVSVSCHGNPLFSIAAGSCYTIADVLVDGISVGAVSSYRFNNVQENHTIAASFTQNMFTIAASAGTGGTITPSGNVSVGCGSNQVFTIAPSSCYSIASVLVDGASVGAVSSYTFTNVTANHTISASFSLNTFTISASAGTGGTITPSGNVSVNCGASQAFSIAPSSCYTIASVLVDGSSVGAVSSYTFTNVTANHTIAASFTQNTFTIAASAGTGGTITPSGNVIVNCGSNQAFTIAASSCYTIANVLVDGSSVGAVSSYTFTNVTANHTIAASFNLKTYTLVASAGTGGTITPSGNVIVNCGASQAFTIAANMCYSIASVVVDSSSIGPVTSYTFTNVTANHSIAASFTLNTYTIAASAGTGGTITPSGNVSVNCGTNRAFTITANSCYSIASVLVDGSSVGAVSSYTFTNVTANHTIAASFTQNTFTIAASAGTGGTITPSGNVSVSCGSNQAFTIAPSSCYSIASVLVDGSSVGAVSGYTFTNVTANHTIAASFTLNTYTIVASAGTGGTITPSGNVSVNCGSNQAFSIAANSCYSIAGVLVDGSSVGAVSSYTFTNVTANHTIAASFNLRTYTIAASAGTGGTITPSGTVIVNCGASQSFSIAANSCYTVASVLVDGSSVGAVSSYTFTNVTANHTIAASFTQNTFTIAASAGTGGTITPSGNVIVNCGSNQAFTIAANSCYTIANVLVDGSSVGAVSSYTFTNVTANHTIAATFNLRTYTIAASAGTGGTITPSGNVVVNCGSSQAFAIAANSCYSIASVLVDGSSVGAVSSYTFTNVTANHTIAASFTLNTFTIAASAGTGGTITPSGNVSVNCGSNQAFSIASSSCYSIASVLVDGSSVGAVSSHTFTNVTANHTIAASFTLNTFTIVASAGTGGTITPSGNVSVNCSANRAFTITANSCYSIANVLVDGSSVGAVSTYTFTNVTANHTISASFTLNSFTIASSAGTGGTITPSGNVTVNCGASQVFTIAANACYLIGNVLVDGSSVGAVTSYTFTNVTANHTIAASFTLRSYTITASAGAHGSISPSGAVTVDCGADQTFLITPDACYHVAGVLVDGASVGAVSSYTFMNVTANHTIAASYAIDTYTLTLTTVGSGSITRNPVLLNYDCGTLVQLTATAAVGYNFWFWGGDTTSSVNPLTITMDSNKAIYAYFASNVTNLMIPDEFQAQFVAGGLDEPVGMAFLPDGRILVVEHTTARIRMIVEGTLGAVDPVGVVDSVSTNGVERGLLGIAIDPGWPQRPYVYTYYTALGGTIRLSRFRAQGDLNDGSSGLLTIPSSTRYDVLRDLPDLSEYHNGGTLRFGPDQKLYLAPGDDADACAAQDSTGRKGAMLRIDVLGLPAGSGGPPSIQSLAPPDNPFAWSSDPYKRLVWAMGFRNPFRFHIDPANGAIFVADVGQETYEEVDQVPTSDLNFGWPYFEGPGTYVSNCGGSVPGLGLVAPIYSYSRVGSPASVIGAGPYRGSGCQQCDFPPEYHGDYFFSDFYSGFLRRLKFSAGSWAIAPPVPGQPSAMDWGRGFEEITDYLNGPDGALWYCRMSIGFQPGTGEIGRIFHVRPTLDATDETPLEVAFAPPYPSPARERVHFTYALPSAAKVELSLYDLMGRKIRSLLPGASQSAGRHHLSWDGHLESGGLAPPGVYQARLMVGRLAIMRRVVLTR